MVPSPLVLFFGGTPVAAVLELRHGGVEAALVTSKAVCHGPAIAQTRRDPVNEAADIFMNRFAVRLNAHSPLQRNESTEQGVGSLVDQGSRCDLDSGVTQFSCASSTGTAQQRGAAISTAILERLERVIGADSERWSKYRSVFLTNPNMEFTSSHVYLNSRVNISFIHCVLSNPRWDMRIIYMLTQAYPRSFLFLFFLRIFLLLHFHFSHFECLIMGDLNLTPDHYCKYPLFRDWINAHTSNCMPVGRSPSLSTFYYNARRSHHTLDYILTSSALAPLI